MFIIPSSKTEIKGLNKEKMIRNKRDYHAKLVIHGLPEMKSVTYRRLVDWLEAKVKDLKKAESGDYSGVYTSKFMK